MPAKKSAALQQGHDTLAEKAQRAAGEAMSSCAVPIPKRPPKELSGHLVARRVWSQIVKQFDQVEGRMLDNLDRHLLIDLCLVEEEMLEIKEMRSIAHEQWVGLTPKVRDAQSDYARLKKERADRDELRLAREMAISLLKANQDLYKTIIQLDARGDQKRKLKLAYYQSMYLTPRSRSGANPEGKENTDKKAEDPMESLINTPSGVFEALANTKRGMK